MILRRLLWWLSLRIAMMMMIVGGIIDVVWCVHLVAVVWICLCIRECIVVMMLMHCCGIEP